MSLAQSHPLISRYHKEVEQELSNILQYWTRFAPDELNGGFVGKIDNDNHKDYSAPKGSVLNARILWSFSAGYNLRPKAEYMEMADRAFTFVRDSVMDKEYGGVFWSVTADGVPLDAKKQVYAIAFAIYGLSEYYIASRKEEAKLLAIQLYEILVKKAFDKQRTGYFEAFTRNWEEIEDLRLSDKDANEKKTMNTHLHVLEAYTTLYRIWPEPDLKDQIEHLIHNFLEHIIDKESGHLILFFDEDWNSKSDIISYGHDIEAAWLLLEAAEVIGENALIVKSKEASLHLAAAAAEGLEMDGSLYYEYEPSKLHLIKEKHWWVQAEAMVGFYNAYQLSGKEDYLKKSIDVWEFTKRAILDKKNGEWFWGVLEDDRLMPDQDKVGMWKCPYHNSRACIEIQKRTTLTELG